MTHHDPAHPMMANPGSKPVVWAVSDGLTDYLAAEEAMAERARRIAKGDAEEAVWLLQHPPLYTAGTSAKDADLVDAGRFPVYRTGRGGQFTYHGPGQRVAYVMLDLKRRHPDVRAFVCALEAWLIDALAALGAHAFRREGRVGLWVPRQDGSGLDDKIAAVGIRLHRWVSFHGISLNVSPDLSHFSGIVPCGIRAHGVTSLAALGLAESLTPVDEALHQAFCRHFGPTIPGMGPLASTRTDGATALP
ncbi:MAG: lipoyl(octanoyl) transferase LipB [Pseudomonadota bacterium]